LEHQNESKECWYLQQSDFLLANYGKSKQNINVRGNLNSL